MKQLHFLYTAAFFSFAFGAVLFFAPSLAALGFHMNYRADLGAILRGMGGLVLGSAVLNFMFRNETSPDTLRVLFLTNIVTHLFGLWADYWALYDSAIDFLSIIPVQVTHFFIGGGSLIFLLQLSFPAKR